MPETGAPQRRWDSLIREFVAAGHEVAVLCPPPHHPMGTVPERFKHYYRRGSAERAENGALVFRVGYLPHRGDIVTRTLDHMVSSLTSIGRAAKLIRRKKFVPDVIIATAPAIPTLIAGQQLSKRFSIPLIVEMRDAWPDLVTHVSGLGSTGSGGPISFAKKLVHRYVTSLQRSATQIVTTTERFGRILENRGMPRVGVVRNGANVSRFTQLPPIDSDHEELRVIYLGTMGRSQGLDVVIRAAHKLKQQGVPVHVRMIGSGHDRGSLMVLNQELGSPVEILPAIAPDQVAAQYEWADTTLVSLRDWKPFEWTIPSKLYEVLSSGRHVTGILAGEGAEILATAQPLPDGRPDVVVQPGNVDALVDYWRDLAEHREKLTVGTSGREWVESNVSYDKLAKRYFEILDGVVPGSEG